MFVSGMIADRLDLRYFLSGGMIGSGIVTIIFGLSKYWNLHSLIYYDFIQVTSIISNNIISFTLCYYYVLFSTRSKKLCVHIFILVRNWNISNKWVAWCCVGHWKLVWSWKKGTYLRHLELSYFDRKYHRGSYCRLFSDYTIIC